MLSKEDRATATGNQHKKFGEDQACSCGDMIADRHTQTDMLITILRAPYRWQSNDELTILPACML